MRKPTHKKRGRVRKARISSLELKLKYGNPSQPGSLGGVERFAKAQGVSVKRARAVLKHDLGYILHKPVRRCFPTKPVIVFEPDEQWAADLVEVQTLSRWNRGIKYFLCVIDVFSKFAWVAPLKSKTGKAVTEAFPNILKGHRTPKKLQTDDGKEFYNGMFREMLKKHNIHHFSTASDTKASVVERFNRTFKQRLYRYFTTYNTLSFVKAVPALMNGYNKTYHRSIGTSPKKVDGSNTAEVWNRLYGAYVNGKRNKAKFRKGDRVRLNQKFRQFKKSYLPGWTEEVFLVECVEPGPVNTYKVVEWDGTPIKGTFYEEDLQKVYVRDDNLFRVEKILRRRGNKAFIRWKGWPQKYDSWVDKKDIVSLVSEKKKK